MKTYFYNILTSLGIYFALEYITYVNCHDVLGCGGYVKSEVPINFSEVKIKLLTQQGNVKYETECAPNNGYYFIRLYDKGDYILKVIPPPGWSFKPEEVVLKVDGETDACSLSEDINFFFKGFAVVGKVVTVGSEDGPPGITVSLKQGDQIVLETLTSEMGNFVFTPLGAGIYDVIASHPRWDIIKNKVTVTVKDGNGDAGNDIVVGGYFLSGSVAVSGETTEKIRIILHSSKIIKHNIGCQKEKLPSYLGALRTYLCYTTLDTNGKYTFSNVPVGKYSLVMHFISSGIKYVVDPSIIDIEVGHGDSEVSEIFQVKGRSLKGQVLIGKKSDVLSGIRVSLNDYDETITDENGKFIFDGVKFGNHVLKFTGEEVQFDEVKVQLAINTADLVIKPSSYKVCFFVSIDSSSGINIPWFGPTEHVFTVETQPIKKLMFSQFLGEIHGVIHCLESCRTLTVSLRPSKGSYSSPRTTTATHGKFVFTEVVPAEYLLTVDKEEWCWKEPTILVIVNAKNVSAKFEQTGFRLTLNASHRTALNYVTNKGHTGKLEVAEGTSRECVSAPGKYIFTPASCHRFGSAPLTWDTSSLQLLSLIASHHQVTGTLISKEPGPFVITVKSEQNSETAIGPLVASPSDKSVYPFEIWLENGETITLIPSSSSNLFQYLPSSFALKVDDECMFSVVQFKAERALFIKGHVKPALKGVTIKVIGESEALSFTTNSEGFFVAGPLDKSQSYNVVAEKVGYIMSPPSQKVEVEGRDMSTLKMSFNAYKLAEIIVKITDENGEPLEGVLVSTSGGKNYRQNSLTEADGTFVFQSLMPSDYFLRPMMKEYNFDPPSQMVEVQGGATVNVQIKGVRVAYSIFGQTTSLSGEAESDVMIEALGIGSKCLDLQEEALSDSQGNFRIRGLTPNCDYKIRLKKGGEINSHVDRSLPKELDVYVGGSDYKGLTIIVMRPFLQMDVSVIIETEKQFLPTLTAELYRDDSLDSPVHSVSIGNHPFFMLPPMVIDNRMYSIQLVSSLSQSHYEYVTRPISFVANSSFIHLSIPFKPVLKMVDAEISRSTVFGLLFFIFSVAITLNYNKIQPILLNVIDSYYSNRPNNSNGKSSVKIASQSQLPIDTAYIEPVNVRKRVKVRKT